MTILGVGIDIVEVERFRSAVRRGRVRFLGRIFSRRELAELKKRRDPTEGLAARFAVKEAVIKAFGKRKDVPSSLTKIEVLKGDGGVPEVSLPHRTLRVLISLSHSRGYAVANAVLLKKGR